MDRGGSSFLSADELFKQYRLPRELPSRRTLNSNTTTAQNANPEMEWEDDDNINEFAVNERDVLNRESRVDKDKQFVYGEWMDEERLIRIDKPKGKMLHNRGIRQGTAQLLFLEEALFLVEQRLLIVMHGGLPLSVEQLYGALCTSGMLLEYQVYAYLSRLGYLVKRFRADSQRIERLPVKPAYNQSTVQQQSASQQPLSSASASASLEMPLDQRPRPRKSKAGPTKALITTQLNEKVDVENASLQRLSENVNNREVPPSFETDKMASDPDTAGKPTRSYWNDVANFWQLPLVKPPSPPTAKTVDTSSARQAVDVEPPSNKCATWVEWRAANDAFERSRTLRKALQFARGAMVDATRTSVWSASNRLSYKINYEAWKPSALNLNDASYRICVTNANAPTPSFGELIELARVNGASGLASRSVPQLLIAIVDQADVNFYAIDNFRVPIVR